MVITGIIIVIGVTALLFYVLFGKNRKVIIQSVTESYRQILSEHVPFYKELNPEKKIEFENRMMLFLSTKRITGIGATVDETDKVFIAASAIIPIFGFPDWQYINLNEVLLYPDSFNHENFNPEDPEKNTLGVVGTGPYQNVMVLSQKSLRESFINKTGKGNVAIHEFVHLIDKTDGDTDGIPEFMMNRQYIVPWLDLMQKEIQKIYDNHSDIDAYGIVSRAEFFAVVSEYFFERPDLLQEKHPELYILLSTIFRQEPKTNSH